MFRSVAVRSYPKLADDFITELVGGAVAAASLGEEGVVVIRAVDQKTGLESPDAAERKVAVAAGCEAAGVLGYAGSQ